MIMSVKKIVKKIAPGIFAIYSKIRDRKREKKIEEYNLEYRKALEEIADSSIFENRCDLISNKIKSNDKLTYYIVGNSNTKVGIFGYVNVLMPHIAYAVSKGYVPVLDMQNYRNIYNTVIDGKVNNSWELFFEQPFSIGLEKLQGGKKIYCPDELWYRWMPNSFPLMNNQEIEFWGNIFHKFVRCNMQTQKYLDEEYNNILYDKKATIGVIYRGTTYTKGQAKGHPIQPSMKMLADKVEEFAEKYHASAIYLASDEKSIVDYFEKRFPRCVLVNKRVYYDEVDVDYSTYNSMGTDITGQMFNRDNNEYLIGIEYISSINLVSKCDYLVAGACGGTTAALYMNNNRYKDKYVFNLGRYGYDPVPKN